MLTNLRIKNFRMLEDLEIPKLGRVNLIVGKNNSGKSTILEALRIYAGKAHPELLGNIIIDHDESFKLDQEDRPTDTLYGLKNLFPGRVFPTDDNNFIQIESNSNLVKIEYVFYYMEEFVTKSEDGLTTETTQRKVVVKKSNLSNNDKKFPAIPAIRIGRNTLIELNVDPKLSSLHPHLFWNIDNRETLKFSLVSTNFITPEKLAQLWDKIAASSSEEIVYRALQIVDPTIEKLAFINGNTDSSLQNEKNFRRIAIVKLKNSEIRAPLNSMGDGMTRILQLILSVFPAKDGILLIDEFENGLHYSVQEEVWRIIFQLAKELNIQVFATTHSWDCIESFTKAAVESPEEGVLLKVSRSKLTSDHGKVIATVYDETELETITASELEIR
ncbi:AAA family ATPase [Methylomonas sp. TEB]|uniref:AAA family ATPase n=1 Tax=Methylomonas sp. TEB TaxID=3398229 RepID=UPI0039F60C7F